MPSADLLQQAYVSLRRHGAQSEWLSGLCDLADHSLQEHVHGDLPRWRAALQALPATTYRLDADHAAPGLGETAGDREKLEKLLMEFHPWRKGPLTLAGVEIDTEWRSDWKWARVRPHIDLREKRVLDIGCGNGYFGWRMLADGAKLVIGIDPTLVFVMQWLACRHFAGDAPNYVLPLGIEDLPPGYPGFDNVFSMGVLYHRRDPMEHLAQIRTLLKPGGSMVLETLVLPENHDGPMLVPEGRYARMRNVWAVPTTTQLGQWVEQTGFSQFRLVDVTPTTIDEQRSTDWMKFESLSEALDPQNRGLTVEGYPAPTRATLVATN